MNSSTSLPEGGAVRSDGAAVSSDRSASTSSSGEAMSSAASDRGRFARRGTWTGFGSLRGRFTAIGVFAAILGLLAPPAAHAVSTTIVISQVYGAGGNSGATYQND